MSHQNRDQNLCRQEAEEKSAEAAAGEDGHHPSACNRRESPKFMHR